MKTIRWKEKSTQVHYKAEFGGEPKPFHVARLPVGLDRRIPLHTHDFPELFVVERGSVWHHVNGEKLLLKAGDLVLIRPRDQHGLDPVLPEGHRHINVSFSAETLQHLKKRYFSKDRTFWGGREKLPQRVSLSQEEMRSVVAEMESLLHYPPDKFEMERFLINLLHRIRTRPDTHGYDSLPDWLRNACEKIHHPDQFIQGPQRLARLANHCLAHVSRELKKRINKTPTEIVNEARVEHAARLLSFTSKKIIEIGMDCGFESQAHFYKLFQRRYGVTPRRYRLVAHE